MLPRKFSRPHSLIIIASMVIGFASAALAQSKSSPATSPAGRQPQSQQQPATPAPTLASSSNSNTIPQPAWNVRCGSVARQAPLECILEQQVVVQQTGQQLSLVSVRVPGDTRQPVMLVQLPLGMYLPGGLTLQVDEEKGQLVTIQSCDQRACYVGLPITTEMLTSLKKGQRLKLIIQSANREPVTIPHPLSDFADQYQKIQ